MGGQWMASMVDDWFVGGLVFGAVSLEWNIGIGPITDVLSNKCEKIDTWPTFLLIIVTVKMKNEASWEMQSCCVC